jgi:hypothetical protein
MRHAQAYAPFLPRRIFFGRAAKVDHLARIGAKSSSQVCGRPT